MNPRDLIAASIDEEQRSARVLAEYEVVWSGSSKAPIPGIGTVERTASYLTDRAHDRTPTDRGKRLTPTDAEQELKQLAREAKKQQPPLCACGAVIPPWQWHIRLRRCATCRGKAA